MKVLTKMIQIYTCAVWCSSHCDNNLSCEMIADWFGMQTKDPRVRAPDVTKLS